MNSRSVLINSASSLLVSLLIISSPLLITSKAVNASEILLDEDFNYKSRDELASAGWIIQGKAPSNVDTKNGMLNVYPGGGMSIKKEITLPANFVVEVRARSPDNSRIYFSIGTSKDSVIIDDNPYENWFYVGMGGKWPGELVYKGSEKLTDLRQFQIYRIEIESGNVRVYKNGELIGSRYIDSFKNGGKFILYTTSFWNTRFQIDYIRISGVLTSKKSLENSNFPEISLIKYPENPLESIGEIGSNPVVIYDGKEYKMYFERRGEGEIYLATSKDGIKWNVYGKVLSKGPTGSWDGDRIALGSVIYDGHMYRMWYVGMDKPPHRGRVGYAESLDGIHWRKYRNNPVLVPGGNGGWDDWNIWSPAVTFNGTHYIMMYAAQAYIYQYPHGVGMAYSTDGIHWIKYRNNPVLPVGKSGEWDDFNHAPCSLYFDGSKYHLWYYSEDGPSGVFRIGYAHSENGINWIKHPDNPMLEPSKSGWDSFDVSYCSALYEENGLKIYYVGFDGQKARIGLAYTANNLTHLSPFEKTTPALKPTPISTAIAKTSLHSAITKIKPGENSILFYSAIIIGTILSAYSLRRFYISLKNNVILEGRYLLISFFVLFFTIGVLNPEPISTLPKYAYSFLPNAFWIAVVDSIIAGMFTYVIVEILFYPSNKESRYGATLFATLCILMFEGHWWPFEEESWGVLSLSLPISFLLSIKVPKSWTRGKDIGYYNVIYIILAILYFFGPIFTSFIEYYYFNYKLFFRGLFSQPLYVSISFVESPTGQPNLVSSIAENIFNPNYFFPRGLIAFVLFIGTFYHNLTKEIFYTMLILIILSIVSPFIGYFSPFVCGITSFFAGKIIIKFVNRYQTKKKEYEEMKKKLISEMDELIKQK